MTTANILSQLGSPGVSTGFKNRIINGAMAINQRGTVNTPVTPVNQQYVLDRFNSNTSQTGKYSIQQSTTAPAGFGYSLLATSLSAFSVGASDFFDIFQPIEGFNFADAAFGTSSAKSITISFWINASIAGTYGGYLLNPAGSRTCVLSYSVPVANTWTYVTATVPGDTTGTWVGATNGVGIYIVPISLGCGSTYTSSTTNTWLNGSYRGFTGQVNMVGTSGSTVYITGLQVEIGTTATNFEVLDYGRILIQCQRYYQVLDTLAVVPVVAGVYPSWTYIVSPRTTPTMTYSYAGGTGATFAIGANGFYQSGNHSIASGFIAYVFAEF